MRSRSHSSPRIGACTLVALPVLLAGCGGAAWKAVPHDQLFQYAPAPVLHPRPRQPARSEWWYALVHTTLRPTGEAVSPGHHLETILGGSDALDVNAFGQVSDSTWFTNRIGRRPMTREEIAHGPNTIAGPAEGPLLVLGGKVEGATPGLVVRDQGGHIFIVKFDPPAFPGLSSSAEVIATKLLFAAGYNVPENFLSDFRLDQLELSPHATTKGAYGEKISLDEVGLRAIIAHVNPYADGSIRAMFSRLIPGETLGSFDYRGCRSDDPNDRIPHERRRALRGLKVFSAWIHNTDIREANTLDTYVRPEEKGELGTIKHYLLDFGDALGASGTKPKYAGEGYEYRVDWAAISEVLFTLGIAYPYWLPIRRSPYRSVGIFESDVFEPSKWRPNIPNPAFDASTPLDDYWAASILARFTPDLLREVVKTGQYTEPGAEEWVLRVLMERQYRLLQSAFDRVLALDDPRIEERFRLRLADLEVDAWMMVHPERVHYRCSVRWNRTGGFDRDLLSGEVRSPSVDLGAIVERIRSEAGESFHADPFLTVTFWRPRGDRDGPKVEVHLRVLEDGLLLVGLDREVI